MVFNACRLLLPEAHDSLEGELGGKRCHSHTCPQFRQGEKDSEQDKENMEWYMVA